jgi:hypothetical protein
MKVEFMALKGTREVLLGVHTYESDSFDIVWPDVQDYFTNNFDSGTEFIRISEIQDYDSVFMLANEQVILITAKTPYNSGFADINGVFTRSISVQSNFDLSDYGNGYIDLQSEIALLRVDIQNLESVINGY